MSYGTKQCVLRGEELNLKDEMCPACGVRQPITAIQTLMKSHKSFSFVLLIALVLFAPFNTVSASFYFWSDSGASLEVDIQHDRIDRLYLPEGRPHKFTVVMDLEILSSAIDHVEFWVWMNHTAGEPVWRTNILDVEPSYPAGTHSGPSYDHDGWYACEVNAVQNTNFSGPVVITLEYTIEINASLSPLPFDEYYELMKCYAIVSGKFGSDKLGPGGFVGFTTEPFIYPADTPVTFDNPDSSGVKVTFDVSPKIVKIPFEVEQKWHIEAEFEVLENDTVEWVAFIPHLMSTMFETPVSISFEFGDRYQPHNKIVTIIDKEGVHRGEIDIYVVELLLDGYTIYMDLFDGGGDEDIDGRHIDDDIFLSDYWCTAEVPDGDYFDKGDKIRFEFDVILPAWSVSSTPHELVKTSFTTNCDTLGIYRLLYERRYNVYFELGPRADDWPMFRHDLAHSGYSSSEAPDTDNILWSYYSEVRVVSSPAVAYGKVYVSSMYSDVYCLDADTGAWIWSYTTGGGVYSSPAVAYSKVYIGSNDGKVYCLDAGTGAWIWNYTTGDDVHSSPAVTDGKVYVGSRDGKVYCLDADTGTKIWSYTTGGGVYSSPAIADGKVYVGSWDDNVYCLDAGTGAWIWNYTTGDRVFSSPAVADGKVYVGSYDGKVYCLDAGTGAKIWNYTTGAAVDSSPAVAYGKVYIGSRPFFYCLDADTGAKIWSYTTGYWVYSSPAVADGKVYIGSEDDNVYCLDADTGAEIWSYTTIAEVYSSPAVAYGKVYIGPWDGNVYCFASARASQVGGFEIFMEDRSGNELAGVNVRATSRPGEQSALDGTTGSDGRILFEDVELGDYSFSASKSGYVSGTGSGKVDIGEITSIIISLEKEASGGIPGFPLESLVLGTAIVSVFIWMMRKRY